MASKGIKKYFINERLAQQNTLLQQNLYITNEK